MTTFSFKKLLPATLKNTRWGNLINVFQTVYDLVKTESTEHIIEKYIYDEMTDEEARDWVYRVGFDLPTYEGYTSTIAYSKKRAKTIIRELTRKWSPDSYELILYTFNMAGTSYPMRYLSAADPIFFEIQRTNAGHIFEILDITILDQESAPILFYVGLNPVPADAVPTGLPVALLDSDDEPEAAQFLFLDGNKVFDYTRHFLVSWKYNFIESATEFATTETLRALYETVYNQNKRATEVPHFQVQLPINTKNDSTATTETLRSEDGTITSAIKSIFVDGSSDLYNPNLLSVTKIELGIGAHTDTISTSITGCANTIATLPFTGNFNILARSQTQLTIESYILSEFYKFPSVPFTELALKDDFGDCVLYAKFPEISFYDQMFSSVYFDIKLVSP